MQHLDPNFSAGPTRRPPLISLLAVIAVIAVLKDLIDLFSKPVDLQLPNHDVQVWFGYRFEGMIAKILTIPHLLVYGSAAYGLFRMMKWGWWVTFVYLLYIPVSFVLYLLWYGTGEAWEIGFAVVSGVIIIRLVIYLYKNRHLFVH
jgi:hypothetical protein